MPKSKTPKVLRLFISYAREDLAIALAVQKALKSALGSTFADVFLDQSSLRVGSDYPAQLEEKLQETNVLVVIYSGVEKPSHSYTGFEIGFYRGVQAKGSQRNAPLRLIVPMYLSAPPTTVATKHGFGFGISKAALQGTEANFEEGLDRDVANDHAAVRFLEEMQDYVGEIGQTGGYPKRDREDSKKCIRDMFIGIFRHLKTTVEETLRPQRRLIIKSDMAAFAECDGIPVSAIMESEGAISIFGAHEGKPGTWGDFLTKIDDHKYGSWWKSAISSVVVSSIRPQVDLDNNQIVISLDDTKAYRVILTADSRYYDGRREFKLYFVETMRPREFGNQETTLLLKGLEIVCRFRFMFLEEFSDFTSNNVLLLNEDKFVAAARGLLRELNLLNRDALAAGLDKPNVWGAMVQWEIVTDMSNQWAPFDQEMRLLVAEIIEAKRVDQSPENMKRLQVQLAELLGKMEVAIRPLNGRLIQQMTQRLERVVDGGLAINATKSPETSSPPLDDASAIRG